MAYQNLATELTFNYLQNDDVFPTSGVLTSLKKYEKFIEVYVNDPSNQAHPLPPKVSKDRVVGNGLIRAWAAWKAPPLLLAFICGGLPPNGDVAVRVREIARACILAAPQEYHQKRYGEILSIIVNMVAPSSTWLPTRHRRFTTSRPIWSTLKCYATRLPQQSLRWNRTKTEFVSTSTLQQVMS